MKKRLERALLAAGAVVFAMTFASVAKVEAKEQVAMLSSFAANMAVGGNTAVPLGYAQFCARNPADCAGTTGRGGKVALTEANFAQLRKINDEINERIQPMTDLDHYGEVERWAYPDDGYGDCEDYALLKRRTLIELGWPADTLLITVVRDRKGDYNVSLVELEGGARMLSRVEGMAAPAIGLRVRGHIVAQEDGAHVVFRAEGEGA